VIAERYWLAKVLGSSRSMKSYQLILRLLDDPQPNVVCMAMFSLGRQHQPNAEHEILRRIKTYDHWYVQWYAYKALKRLGWTQKK
jgi:HEAT repeat protein